MDMLGILFEVMMVGLALFLGYSLLVPNPPE